MGWFPAVRRPGDDEAWVSKLGRGLSMALSPVGSHVLRQFAARPTTRLLHKGRDAADRSTEVCLPPPNLPDYLRRAM